MNPATVLKNFPPIMQVCNGRHCVTSTTLKPPQSLLGGFGRRMSSLIFGSIPAAGAAEAVSI